MRTPPLLLALLLLAGVGGPALGDPRTPRVLSVLGPRGRPLPGARLLTAAGEHAGRPVFESGGLSLARADREGILEIPAGVGADSAALFVWTPGTAPARVPRGVPRATLRLLAARATAGTVRLAGGAAASGRPVLAVPSAPQADLVQRVRTDAQGVYRLDTLHAGSWDLFLDQGAGRLQRIGRVEAGDSLGETRLRSNTVLRGRLLDVDGTRTAPVADVEVRFESRAPGAIPERDVGVRTGPDGAFQATGLSSGVHRVVLVDEGWALERSPLHVHVEEGRRRELPRWFALRLRAVEGRVLDLAGNALSGAQVRLVPDTQQVSAATARGSHPDPVGTDGGGRFRVSRVRPAEGYRLLVAAAGHAPWVSDPFRVDRGRDTKLEAVRLRSGWRARLRVRSVDGDPVEAAVVRAVPAAQPTADSKGLWAACVRYGVSDDGGFVELTDLPADDVLIAVRASGWLAAHARVAYPRVSDRREAEVVLHRAASLTGQVLAHETGPAGPYRLRAVPRDGQGVQEVSSDSQGRFRVDDLAGTSTDLHVLQGAGAGAGERTLAILEGVLPGAEEYLELQLPPRRRVAGRVSAIDPEGGPVDVVAETRVYDVQQERDAWRQAARASVQREGSSGSFVLTGLAPGGYALRAVQGARDSGAVSVLLLDEDVDSLELRLPAGAQVAGTVLDAQSRPLLGARVTLTRWHGDAASALRPADALTRSSDERGSYVFEDLAPGLWRIAAGHEGAASDVEIVRLLDGEVRVVRDLQLGLGGTLEGRIEDADGRPLDAVRVDLQRMDADGGFEAAISDANGRFRARWLRAGTWRLQVQAATAAGGPWLEALADVEEGRTTVVAFEASEDGAIGGTVRLRGQPVPGAAVDLIYDGPAGAALRRYRTRTDVEGRFVIEQLRAGSYSIHVQSGSWRRQEELELQAGDRLQLDLEAYEGRLRGRVITPAGEPVGGARVIARPRGGRAATDEDGAFFAECRSAPTGDFVLRGLPVGIYSLAVTARGHPPGRLDGAQADLPGADFRVEVVLGRGGDLQLRVLDARERGVTGAQIWVLDDEDRPLESRAYLTGAAGRLRIEGVPAGSVRIRVRARGLGAPAPLRVLVEEGRTSALQIRLAPAGVLRLTVSGDAGDPLGRTSVDVLRAVGGEVVARRRPLSPIRLGDPWGWVPRTGVVTIGELAEGEYDVRVGAGRLYQPQTVRVRVEAGRTTDFAVELRTR